MRLLCLFATLLFFSACGVPVQAYTGNTLINATVSGLLEASLQYPEITVSEDYYFYENLTVFQSGPVGIHVYLNKSDPNSLVKFVNRTGEDTYYQDDYVLYVPSNSSENATLRIYVPPNQGFNGGTFNVQIYARSMDDKRTDSDVLKIHVNNTNPIDDIQIKSIQPSGLYSGEELSAEISIHKISPSEITDIQICYCVHENPAYSCGPVYNDYGCEWKAIGEWLNYTKTVLINENPGEYHFIVAVKYPGDENIKRASSPEFYVMTAPSPPGISAGGAVVPPKVEITLDIISPLYVESYPGGETAFTAEVRNAGNAEALNTSISVYGISEEWVSVNPSAADISAGGVQNYTISLFIPFDAQERAYPLTLIAKSGSAETRKTLTLVVASTAKNTAQLFIAEALSKKERVKMMLRKADNLGLNTENSHDYFLSANAVLEDAEELFRLGNYSMAKENAKRAIEKYKSAEDSLRGEAKRSYYEMLSLVKGEFTGLIKLLGRDTADFVQDKIEESLILIKEGREIEAYETLLDAKQVLEEAKEKIYFRNMTHLVMAISAIIVMGVVVSAFLFYRRKVSKLVRILRFEEHKRRLRHIFGREVRPFPGYRKRVFPAGMKKPISDELKSAEIRVLLVKGTKLLKLGEVERAKETFAKIRRIYNSMTPEGKKSLDEEMTKLRMFANEIVKKTRKTGR